ncbi:DUF3168 domain-containing protein [Roseitranquillus sediminis]|uniref:DUF3168 domain-containing protein n=1 Tax=Roseitranquillus sediminis TaxID=2809051 RepID=UPI001D0C1235|nr:DUF3168 domain-containing protein [Roseitranquillus sediminis]MBM9595209.1 DUF3168 domain-containing protein [Roseitranquillus sediminis]
MSYGMSAALQQAVYQRLMSDAAVNAEVGEAIYDVVPAGQVPSTYVSIGPEDVRDWSDKSGHGARHDFVVSVVTDAAGFQTAKAAAGAIADALVGTRLPMVRGHLVALNFRRAQARRLEAGTIRRIDLSFRAHVQDTHSTESETK